VHRSGKSLCQSPPDYFFYLNAAGGACTSLAISMARIAAAALSGVNTEFMDESLLNAAVDIAGLTVVYFLWRRDQEAEQSRLKRATKGAGIAKLTVRASKQLLWDVVVDEDSSST
jgi:hypothetical protein